MAVGSGGKERDSRRGDGIDQGRYGHRVGSARRSSRQGRKKPIQNVVWNGHADRLGRQRPDDRRAESVLPRLDPSQLPHGD